MRIDLVRPEDERVQAFESKLLALQPTQLAWVLLFGELRREVMEVVAFLSVEGMDASLATLSARDELKNGHATIHGLWIDPEFKSHRSYLDYGVALFRAIAEESWSRYHEIPSFVPSSITEVAIAEAAIRQGVQCTLIPIDGLPDW